MKKIIILAILCVGMGLSSQAQSLNCKVFNTSSTTWKVKVFNAASPGAINLVVPSGAPASGTVSPAAFPLKLILSNGTCSVIQSIGAPMSPTTTITVTDSCGNNHIVAATKTANGNYAMKVLLN